MRIRRTLVIALAIATAPALAGCSVAENIVGGVVNEAQNQAGDAIGEALGGAGVSTDGELPTGFPADAIPLVGAVQGGGTAPEGSGWVVVTTLGADDSFATAQAALEGAGFVGSAVDADADSGFGTFTLAPYGVVLTVTSDADGVQSASYIVSAN